MNIFIYCKTLTIHLDNIAIIFQKINLPRHGKCLQLPQLINDKTKGGS